jgi:putative membrane protein
MNRLTVSLCAATSALLLAGLCSTVAAQTAASAPASGAAAASRALSAADKDFLLKAAQGGQAEVETSKLAASKATSPEVKSFAAQMVTDHTKANDELKALASSKGVTLPSEPSTRQKAGLKKLEAATGADFDHKYADSMGVGAHRETVALFKKASTSSQDADVKAWAAQTLPTLERHLKMAEDLKKNVVSKK